MRTPQTISCLLTAVLLAQTVLAASNDRAQYWKTGQTLGSSQLSLDELAYVVRPESESKALDAAIEDFVELYELKYSQKLEIISDASPKQSLSFQRSEAHGIGGGFTISRERTRVTIQATDAEGWRNGLYAIMEDMMGARWYWAGELGFEWADPERGHLTNRPWIERPAFVQRQFYPVGTDFGRRNRLNAVYSFNHNLGKVFTKELFESRPEVFSEVNGRRKVPRGSGGTDPQPDFTHPGAVEVAAQAALAHFDANPGSSSYSLSINDNVLFDTREPTEAAVTPLRYFRGRPDYTDLVFGFMNQVAERVFDQAGAWQTPDGEDRYLTALAYYWTEPAPGFRIHSRVMPVLTSDRAQWHDPDYRAEDKALIRAWAASGAERIATWDYYFGSPYIHPRQFNQWIAESLPFMADAGVDVFFSQLPSFWGLDGGKAWLAAELVWEPDQDSAALLDEYYHNFFGAAAEPMRTFYETAEAHRNAREGSAEWIKLYKDESGVALFTPEVLQAMRACLDEAEQMVGVPPLDRHSSESDGGSGGQSVAESGLSPRRFQSRVKIVSAAFRLTELYARYDGARRDLVDLCLDGTETERIELQLNVFRQSKSAYYKYVETYAGSDYAPNISLGQSDPEAFALRAIQGKPEGRFASLSGDQKLAHQAWYERNFLGPRLPWLGEWYLDYRPSEDFKVAASEWGGGDSGLRISDADIISVFRTFPVVPNLTYEFRMRAAWQISLDNRVHIHVNWLDAEGRSLRSGVPLRLPYGERDKPADICIPFSSPENSAQVRFRIVTSRQYPGDYLDISELDFGTVD